MVIEELLDIISEYTDLDIESIDKELQNVSSEFAEIKQAIEYKAQTLEELDEALEMLSLTVENDEEMSKYLEIETNRARKKQEDIEKNIAKLRLLLKTYDAGNVKIEVRPNDKEKLSTLQATLDIMKPLMNTHLTADGKGFVVNSQTLSPQRFELNKNQSKEADRVLIWKNISSCSSHSEEWNQIL